MPEPEDKPLDANGAPTATDNGDQDRIVDSQPEWKQALAELAKTDPSKADALSKKLEGYDKVLTKKLTGLSQREREIVQLAETLKASATKPSASAASVRTESRKILDDLEDKASTAEDREGIRKLRAAIREETDIEKLKETVASLEKRLQDKELSEQSVRKTTIAKELKALDEKFGEEFMDKYRDQVEAYSVKFPEHSPRKWLNSLADPDELEQALRIHLKKQDSKPNGASAEPPKKQGSSPVTSTKPTPAHEQYKGKTPLATRMGLDKAIGDSVKSAFGKLAIGR